MRVQAIQSAHDFIKAWNSGGCFCGFVKARGSREEVLQILTELENRRHHFCESIVTNRVLRDLTATALQNTYVKQLQSGGVYRLEAEDRQIALFFEPHTWTASNIVTVPEVYGQCMGFSVGTMQRCRQDAKCTFKVYSPRYTANHLVGVQEGRVLHVCGDHCRENGLIRKMGVAIQQIFPEKLDADLASPNPPTLARCKEHLKLMGLSQLGGRDELLIKLRYWRGRL